LGCKNKGKKVFSQTFLLFFKISFGKAVKANVDKDFGQYFLTGAFFIMLN
jgi:hypothetical protein